MPTHYDIKILTLYVPGGLKPKVSRCKNVSNGEGILPSTLLPRAISADLSAKLI